MLYFCSKRSVKSNAKSGMDELKSVYYYKVYGPVAPVVQLVTSKPSLVGT